MIALLLEYPRLIAMVVGFVVLSGSWFTIGCRFASKAAQIEMAEVKLQQAENIRELALNANLSAKEHEKRESTQKVVYKTQVQYVDRVIAKDPDMANLRVSDDSLRLWNDANAGRLSATDSPSEPVSPMPRPSPSRHAIIPGASQESRFNYVGIR